MVNGEQSITSKQAASKNMPRQKVIFNAGFQQVAPAQHEKCEIGVINETDDIGVVCICSESNSALSLTA